MGVPGLLHPGAPTEDHSRALPAVGAETRTAARLAPIAVSNSSADNDDVGCLVLALFGEKLVSWALAGIHLLRARNVWRVV